MEKLRKIYLFLRGLIGRAGACFMTVFIFFALFARLVLKINDFAYDSAFFGYTALFSFIIALSDMLISGKLFPSRLIRVTIKYVIATADFSLVLCYLSGAAKGGKQILALTLAFTVVYAVGAAVCGAFAAAYKKNKNKSAAYSQRFSPKSEDK